VTDIVPTPLTLVGDPAMGVCEGDFCEVPQHYEVSIVNSRLDDGEI
jgi:hypothetical protein